MVQKNNKIEFEFLQSTGSQFGPGNGSGKLFGGVKYPILRRDFDDDPALHTPQCSQSGKTPHPILTYRAQQNMVYIIVTNLQACAKFRNFFLKFAKCA